MFLASLLGALALAAGLRYLLRPRGGPVVTDDVVRRIEEHGTVEIGDGEPLDLEQIEEEERRFWEEEEWDRADPL